MVLSACRSMVYGTPLAFYDIYSEEVTLHLTVGRGGARTFFSNLVNNFPFGIDSRCVSGRMPDAGSPPILVHRVL
jgi:hypothetical protein